MAIPRYVRIAASIAAMTLFFCCIWPASCNLRTHLQGKSCLPHHACCGERLRRWARSACGSMAANCSTDALSCRHSAQRPAPSIIELSISSSQPSGRTLRSAEPLGQLLARSRAQMKHPLPLARRAVRRRRSPHALTSASRDVRGRGRLTTHAAPSDHALQVIAQCIHTGEFPNNSPPRYQLDQC